MDTHTTTELKEWLKCLNLKTSGTKADLVKRLNEVPHTMRGNCPTAPEGASAGEIALDNDEIQALKAELKNIKIQCELLTSQNEKLLRKINTQTQEADAVDAAVTELPFDVVKEFLPEFNDDADFTVWVEQFRNLTSLYTLDDNFQRMLLMNKLKGKARQWLQSKPNLISERVSDLLQQLAEFFEVKENKMILRRKFQMRTWLYTESFLEYYKAKTSMAKGISMEEDELVDCIIEGIPDEQLRTQAHMQCYRSTASLVLAFSKIQLKKVVSSTSTNTKAQKAATVVRCYNCNSLGHFAADCKKPKREMGACFACGSKEHRIAACPDKKSAVQFLEDNEYVRYFNIKIIDKTNISLNLECLIDSGSPVSLIKRSSLSNHFHSIKNLLKCNNKCFFGINKSKLKVFGQIRCIVDGLNKIVELSMLVVTDESMSFDVILGRDFLRACRLKLCDIEHVSKNNEERLLNAETENCRDDREKLIDVCKDESCKENSGKLIDVCKTVSCKETSERVKDVCESIDCREASEELIDMCECESNVKDEFPKFLSMIENEKENEFDMCIGDQLHCTAKKRLISIFEEEYVKPKRPVEPLTKCFMNLNLENAKPFGCPPRRLSYAEKKELQKLLDEYVDKGYIRASESEFVSPIVLVRKKSGELRMCVDYRVLNKMTCKDNYPIPLIDDLLDRLGNKKIFTKLDLKNGFYHVFMNEESVKYTSFVTPMGQYEFLRMPFGLKNAPSMFQRFVNKVFADMIRDGKLIVYLDDIMIATENEEEHFEILKEVFAKLVSNKLELRLDKCEFFATSVKYLGYTITGDGIRADDKGLQAIQNFPVPQKLQAVQSFLGLCSYFRRFVKDFSVLAKPLYDLIRKNKEFKFGKEELECFENLKRKLVESPILALYDPNDTTELHCDASSIGYGAILMQKKKDGKMHPVFYFSKRTTTAESKYHSFELETLAIVNALQRFRIYLQGIKFKIVTDCNSLALTLNKKELNPRIARWALELQNFDYVLEHRSGQRMQHVDALSRCTNILVIETNTFEENLVIGQGRDAELNKIREKLEKTEHNLYEMRNGVVYRKKRGGSLLFFVPTDMQKHVIYKYHDEMGHVGTDKVTELILKTYWFPKMRDKVINHIQNCLQCISFSAKNRKNEGVLHTIPKSNKPFDVIHIDHYGPVDKSTQKKYILVVIDSCTKFTRLYATKTTNTKEVINALSDYFRSYSRPRCIISDRGTSFTSGDFKEFVEAHNIQHIKIATGSPEANGQVERVNRSIGPMIAKLVDQKGVTSWVSVLEQVEFCLNNTHHRTINEHPSIMLFGIRQRGQVVDYLQECLDELCGGKECRTHEEIRSKAADAERKVQEYNEQYVNSKRRESVKYVSGDYVMVTNFDSHAGISRKLIPKFRGPYRVSKVLRNDRYLLEDVENFQQSRAPYKGVWSASNMKPWVKGRGSYDENGDLEIT